MLLRGKKLGLLLSSSPGQPGFQHGLRLAETAASYLPMLSASFYTPPAPLGTERFWSKPETSMNSLLFSRLNLRPAS